MKKTMPRVSGRVSPGSVALASVLLAGCALLAPDPKPVSLKADWETVTSSAQHRPAGEVPRARTTVAEQDLRRPSPSPAAGKVACRDVSVCVSQLRAMVDDPDRAWINQPEAPATFANGVRLFAYRALRRKLACGELVRALEDVRVSTQKLDTSMPGRRAEQIQRVKVLAGEVQGELQDEIASRCRNVVTGVVSHRP
ncbi:MAG: hypothetical protein F9K29_22470 [Hyphomicrobiaceae bacterium]|nr:MAG: hypothetical protein F9K29_22470 [Hyphomicrobiaceae bacterium]